MKIALLVLLTALLSACAVVPLAPPPFIDGPGYHGHFVPVPVPVPPPPPFFHHRFPGGHHHR